MGGGAVWPVWFAGLMVLGAGVVLWADNCAGVYVDAAGAGVACSSWGFVWTEVMPVAGVLATGDPILAIGLIVEGRECVCTGDWGF